MNPSPKKIETIDQYIEQFSLPVQRKLLQLKRLIKNIAPEAEEKIGYGIPTFVLNKNLVHFASYEKHIGFYPTPSAIKMFKDELSIYKTSKGAVQFPIDKPLPITLIKKIVKFRVKENLERKKL